MPPVRARSAAARSNAPQTEGPRSETPAVASAPSPLPRRLCPVASDPSSHTPSRSADPARSLQPDRAGTVLRHLQMTDPDAFPDDRVRRTLERRVRDWRALHGAPRDVIFRQAPEPGRMALSDFTDAGGLGVTIAGEPFDHRLYHFSLAYSGWEPAAVVLGGESFAALAEHLQDALWALGKVPCEHRTDSLSAACRNLDREAAEDASRRYDELCARYGLIASERQPGRGARERRCGVPPPPPQDRPRPGPDPAWGRDFASLAEHRGSSDELVARRNRRREARVRAEMAALRPLPSRRTTDFTELVARVTRTGGFLVHGVFYEPRRRAWSATACASMCATTASRPGSGRATRVVAHPRRRRATGGGRRLHGLPRTLIRGGRPPPRDRRAQAQAAGLRARSTETASCRARSTPPPGRASRRRHPRRTPAGAWRRCSRSPTTRAARPSSPT